MDQNQSALNTWSDLYHLFPEISWPMTYFNTLPKDKNFDVTKLKAFADDKNKICFGNVKKYCEKRRKCWLPAFCPFPTIFSKGLIVKVFKTQDCVVKG